MRNRKTWFAAAAAVAAGLVMAPRLYTAYTYSTLDLTNANNWQINNQVQVSGGMLVAINGGYGAAIYNQSMPNYTEYEVRSTVALTASGGNYITFVRASLNVFQGGGTGDFYAVEIVNPQFQSTPGSPCTATMYISKSVAGVYTPLASGAVPCRNGMQVRAVVISYGTNSGAVIGYVDNQRYLYSSITNDVASGRAGVGIWAGVSGNGISLVELGQKDPQGPVAPTAGLVATWPLPNRIDFHIKPPADQGGPTTTTGVNMYELDRYNTQTGQWEVRIQSDQGNFSDTMVSPGTTYSYRLIAIDFHNNYSPYYQFQVSTAPSGAVDPRGPGLRPTATKWGAMGEQIDLQSGNLNYSYPLVKAQARGGWGASFNLVYNSQIWRRDTNTATTWLTGEDVGYGFGWKVMAGSLQTFRSSFWAVDHYLFTDSTGGEYILTDPDGDGLWTSAKDPTYIVYQPSTLRLYFTDGSFWLMNVVTAGDDHDAGTRYASLMQDRNGNQVLIRYGQGRSVGWANSSARILEVEDVRAVQLPNSSAYSTFSFTYNSDAIPHLTGIQNRVVTNETYTVGYTGSQYLVSPFGTGEQFGPYQMPASVTLPGLNQTTSFTHNANGELQQVTFPYGGWISWGYGSFAFSGGRTYREVTSRAVKQDATGSTTTGSYTLVRDSGDSALSLHTKATLNDPSGAQKVWLFETNTALGNAGLVTAYESRDIGGATVLDRQDYTWDTSGRPYVKSVLNRMMSGGVEKQSKTEQTLDAWGNVTQLKEYNFGSGVAPETVASRVTTVTYVTTSAYTSLFIRNLPLAATTPSDSFIFTYDALALTGTLIGARQIDPSYNTTSYTVRGNPNTIDSAVGRQTMQYDTGGNVTSRSLNGQSQSIQTASTYNFAAPTNITPNGQSSLATTMAYSSFLGLTQAVGPNGATVSMGYDNYGRPLATTSPHGAVTNYLYPAPPNTQPPLWRRAATGTHYTKEWYDGLGRVVKTETGDLSGTTEVPKSYVDTVYAPCGCSPVGKMKQVSQPYAAGGSASSWTVYAYDGMGRVLSVTQPAVGGVSGITTYLYQGNKVKVTDPAGKWKQHEMDAFGNLVTVTEPNPAGGSDFTTTYTYNTRNELLTVNMPRPEGTQTRTFTYETDGKIKAETLPETGQTQYFYDSNRRLSYKIDAKGQKVEYIYDGNNRVTQVKKYASSGLTVDDACQRMTYVYDGYAGSSNAAGRMAAALYGSTDTSCAGPGVQFEEIYSYSVGGLVTSKTLKGTKNVFGYGNRSTQLTSNYTYNSEGQMLTEEYPGYYALNGSNQAILTTGPKYTYEYNTLAQMTGIKEISPNPSYYHLSNMQYGPAGELTNMTYAAGTSTQVRVYNERLQLTRQTFSGGLEFQYVYPTTGNNGQIQSSTIKQGATTVQTAWYSYDSLKRLSSAYTSAGTIGYWGQTYNYDGFGNLNSVVGTNGWSLGANPNTNRIQSTGFTYDNNGNLLTNGTPQTTTYQYDIENRLVKTTTPSAVEEYGYGVGNQRVWRRVWSYQQDFEYYFYRCNGERTGKYYLSGIADGQGNIGFFLIAHEAVVPKGLQSGRDRLGNNYVGLPNTVYLPYGDEYTVSGVPPANSQDKFATYHRDAATGLDYAVNRYFTRQGGRFLNADPYKASGGPADPGSWNRYSYTERDPINGNDPAGLAVCVVATQTSYTDPISGSGTVYDYDLHCVGRGLEMSGLNNAGGGSYHRHVITGTASGAAAVTATEENYSLILYAHMSNSYQDAAYDRVRQALDDLSTASLDSKECKLDLDRIGVTADQVRATSRKLKYEDASTITDLTVAGVTGNPQETSWSVAQYFDSHADATALAGITTNTIYIDSKSWAERGRESAFGGVLHEIMHFLGKNHTQIGTSLGIKSEYSADYSDRLGEDCYGTRH